MQLSPGQTEITLKTTDPAFQMIPTYLTEPDLGHGHLTQPGVRFKSIWPPIKTESPTQNLFHNNTKPEAQVSMKTGSLVAT